MPFRLRKKERVDHGVKRLAAEQIDEARGQLAKRENVEEAIHEARKNVKKTRALLRLAGYGGEDQRLRDIGRALSGVRDTAVMIEVFDALIEKHRASLANENFAHIRRGLEQSKQSADVEKAVSLALDGLDATRRRVADWPIQGHGFQTLGSGFERSYRRARKALHRAEANSAERCYHNFRKRVKEHWYHMRLFENWWTEPLEARTASLKDLETWLGDHHNLAVLREKLELEPNIERLFTLVATDQCELERNSISLGRRLYEQKPKQFVRGLSKLWESTPPRKRPGNVSLRKAKTA